MIIHRHVPRIPSRPGARPPAIAMDAMADTTDGPQRVDIDVNHAARRRPFIALNRHGRRDARAIQAERAEPVDMWLVRGILTQIRRVACRTPCLD